MKRIALALVPMAIFLVGCGEPAEPDVYTPDTSYEAPPPDPNELENVSGTVEYKVINGVACILYDTRGGGGSITCDWSSHVAQ